MEERIEQAVLCARLAKTELCDIAERYLETAEARQVLAHELASRPNKLSDRINVVIHLLNEGIDSLNELI